MAITSTLTISPSSGTTATQFTGTLVVTNGGASAVNIAGVVPYVNVAGSSQRATSVSLGQVPLGAGQNTSIAPSGTLTLTFRCQVHDRCANGSPGTMWDAYDVGAVVVSSDGSTGNPSTVTYLMTEGIRTQFAGQLRFNAAQNSQYLAAVI